MKKCSKCRETKYEEFFNEDASQSDGMSHYCMACEIPDSDWANKMICLFSEGKSELEVSKGLKVSRKQFNAYMSRSAEFRELVEYGKDLAEAWHLRMSRTNLHNKDFNTPLFKTRMSNLYGWADKVDNKNANSLSLDSDQLRREVADRLPEILEMIGQEKAGLLIEHKPTNDE